MALSFPQVSLLKFDYGSKARQDFNFPRTTMTMYVVLPVCCTAAVQSPSGTIGCMHIPRRRKKKEMC